MMHRDQEPCTNTAAGWDRRPQCRRTSSGRSIAVAVTETCDQSAGVPLNCSILSRFHEHGLSGLTRREWERRGKVLPPYAEEVLVKWRLRSDRGIGCAVNAGEDR